MKCEKCGTDINEYSKFCTNCGESVIKSEPEVIEAEPIIEENITKEETIKDDEPIETNAVTIVEEQKQEIVDKTIKQAEVVNEEKTGLSIASLILGIVAILCIFEHGILNFISAILAIIFGAIGRKKGGKTMGTVGMVLGIISLVLFIFIVTFLLLFASVLFLGIAAS